jgi:Spy/CpxP family protein refolding chaperone
MKRWNPPIALYLFLVFVSGAAVGALGHRLYSPPSARSGAPRLSPEEWRHQYLNEMQTRVNLSAEQMQKVNAIMDETKTRFDAAHDKHHQEVSQIRDEQRARMRALMTPEQLPKWEQLVAERDARSKNPNNKK